MIARIWHGYTSPEHADAYENLLREEIFLSIGKRQIKGYQRINLLRREMDHEVEFITIMIFDSIDPIKEFAGEDYEQAVVPPQAQLLLSRFDARSQHYEIRHELEY